MPAIMTKEGLEAKHADFLKRYSQTGDTTGLNKWRNDEKKTRYDYEPSVFEKISEKSADVWEEIKKNPFRRDKNMKFKK